MNKSLAFALIFALFSLAGVPPLAGFFSKLIALEAFVNTTNYWIVIVAILTSIISAGFYLHIIRVVTVDHPLYNVSLVVSQPISYLISILSVFNIFFMLQPANFIILITQVQFAVSAF